MPRPGDRGRLPSASSQPATAGAAPTSADPLLLAGIVVHWRNEAQLAELTAVWPHDDPRFELVVVDNSGSAPLAGSGSNSDSNSSSDSASAFASNSADSDSDSGPAMPETGEAPAVRRLRPGRNLGFAGGVNAGVAATRAPLLLLLNPDAVPEAGALDRLLEGFAAHPEAAGLAPRLSGPGGEPQFQWQLRPLPSPWACLLQTLPWPAGRRAASGPRAEPAPGTRIEQPAAAALALRRQALVAAGGLDERFYPAWFEDVDLALRLRQAGAPLLYWPAARFRHHLGSTVASLGYGRFLWIYHRNLERYLDKHHGPAWTLAARLTLVAGLALRLPLVALRRPRRAATRRAAVSGLLLALAGALSGWRLPRRLAKPARPRR